MILTLAVTSQKKGFKHRVPEMAWGPHHVAPFEGLSLTHMELLGLLSQDARVIPVPTRKNKREGGTFRTPGVCCGDPGP